MFSIDEFPFNKMYGGFSTADGFTEISENLAEMIKYLSNEPSVGFFFIQQHTQNAVLNIVDLRNKIVQKSHETKLHTEDMEDSITVLSSMKDCGLSLVEDMIEDIKKSLAIMSTKEPRRGLIHNPNSSFRSSWGPTSAKHMDQSKRSTHSVNGVEGFVLEKDSIPISKSDDYIIANSARHTPQQKWAFRMSAHEEFMDQDTDCYSNGTPTTSLAEKGENLDTGLVGSKSVSVEAVKVERPPVLSQGGGSSGGRRRQRRGEDVVHPLKVCLEELYNGTSKKLSLSRNVLCLKCKGKGSKSGASMKCAGCQGSGMKVSIRHLGPSMIQQMQHACNECKGTGESINDKDRCPQCKGEKVMQEKKVLEVVVEKGMQNGQKITFPGEADAAPDTVTGDIVFVLQQKEHPKFTRKGDDLFVKHTLSLTEALCGFQFVLTHLDNSQLLIKSEPGEVVKPEQFKAVDDEGMPIYQRPFMKGKLYIHFFVDFPESLTLDQCKSLEAVLPPRTSAQLSDMEMDECEETDAPYGIESTDAPVETKQKPIFGNVSNSPFGATISSNASTGSSIFGFSASATTTTTSTTPVINPFMGSNPPGASSVSLGNSQPSIGTGATNFTSSVPVQIGSSTSFPTFAFGGTTTVASTSSLFNSSASPSTAKPFSSGASFGLSSSTSSSTANATTAPTSSIFGSTPNTTAPTTTPVFSFGGAQASPATPNNTSTNLLFPFTLSAANTSSSTSLAPSQSLFGNPNPASTFGNASGSNDQMSMEDTMAEDTVQASAVPSSVTTFGQSPISSSPASGFVFGSTPNPFQFGNQQSPATTMQNPFQFGNQQISTPPVNQSPFQASGSLEFNGGGGSFSLGTGGGDKSNRRIVRVKRNARKK